MTVRVLTSLCVINTCAVLTSVTLGGERPVREMLPTHWVWSIDTQGPMCGVYSICRALNVLGVDVEPIFFWKTNYVGNARGSSPKELAAAVEEMGCAAAVCENMSYAELLSIGKPVVANVRRTPFSKTFDHWICVVNSIDGLRVFDGPQASRVIEPPEFLASWSGVGIIVAKSRLTLVGTNAIRISVIVVLLSIAYLVLRYPPWTKPVTLGMEWLPIATATIACALIGNWLYGAGIGHRNAVQLAVAPYRPTSIGTAMLADALAAGRDTSCLLVDARMAEDFSLRSLPNAVNIPVSASHMEISEFVKAVPRDTKIVVFCQSATCEYDERVAMILSQLGFEHVSAANEGFVEFQKQEAATSAINANL